MQLRMSPDPLPGIINTFIWQAYISIFRVILNRQNSVLYVVAELFLAIMLRLSPLVRLFTK